MNDLQNSWVELAGELAWQLSLVVVAGLIAHHFLKSGAWRRFGWQLVFLVLWTIGSLQFTGLDRGLPLMTARLFSAPPEKTMTVQATPPLSALDAELENVVPGQEQLLVTRLSNERLTPAPSVLPLDLPAPKTGSPARNWRWWLVMGWGIGALLVTLRLVISALALEVLRYRSERVAADVLGRTVASLGRQVGLKTAVPVFVARQLTGPIAFGVIRPGIVVPEDFSDRYTPEEQQVALAHELAHLRAADPAWYVLADLISALFWWHPLVWLARRRFQLACEMAADESSIMVTNGPEILAQTLVALGRRQLRRSALGSLGVIGNGFRSGLGQRVQRLLQMPSGGVTSPGRVLAVSVRMAVPLGVAGLFVAGAMWAEAGTKSNKEQEHVMHILKRSWKESALALTFFAATLNLDSSAAPPAVSPQLDPQGGQQTTGEIPRAVANPKVPKPAAVLEPTAPPAQRPRGWEDKSGRELVRAKLESIVLEEVQFDSLPLSEVIRSLGNESTKRSPDGRGVNFLLSHTHVAERSVDPNTGLPVVTEPIDLEGTSIRLQPALKHVRLVDVLDAMLKTSERPLSYSIEDYGVVFSAGPATLPDLQVRTFRVNMETFAVSLQQVFGIELDSRERGPQGQQLMLKRLFQQLGIKLEAPRAAFLNERTGVLMIRVAPTEIDLVSAAVETLGFKNQEN